MKHYIFELERDSFGSMALLKDRWAVRFDPRSGAQLTLSAPSMCGVLPMSLTELPIDRTLHPVDIIEQVAALRDWSFERSGDDEITISIAGTWSDYHVSFSWMEDFEALHLACAFDLKISEHRKTELVRLLATVNECLWVGHFDLWTQESVVMYRHSLLLTGGMEPSEAQVEGLLSAALETCERYYQAFQFVVWAGKTAKEALEGVLFETAGEA